MRELADGARILWWLGLAVVVIGAMPADVCAAALVHHEISVRLEPATREMAGEDVITMPGGAALEFALDTRFAVEQVRVDGMPITATSEPAAEHRRRWTLPLATSPRERTLAVRYRGLLEPLPAADDRDVLRGLPCFADPRGSLLAGGAAWYPEVGAFAFTYRVSLDVPDGQRGLVAGRLLAEQTQGGRYHATFAFAHPAESIDLIAGPYQVAERVIPQDDGRPLRIRTYFHDQVAALAGDYLASVARYVDMYSRKIGPYPFTEFSIVSSPLPTGFGMPTLTYMGVDVLRLPFIRDTSLGHEILHNWWGNGVYVDFARGNWSEGLTAFMADYAYKEQEGPDAAHQARLEMLQDIGAIPASRDMPIRRFTSRTHDTSQIIGYHKATFVFLMLRDMLGEAVFDAGIRRFWRTWQFRQASWQDLQRAFEDAAGQSLERFFDQWLSRTGAPRIAVEAAQSEQTAGKYRVHVALAQGEPVYLISVPLSVKTTTDRTEYRVAVSAARQAFVLDTSARPISVMVDPGFRLLRGLDPDEAPPTLRQVTLDPSTVTLVVTENDGVKDAAMELARRLLDHPPTLAELAVPATDAPLLVIGLRADVDLWLDHARLPTRPEVVRGSGSAQVWTSRQANGKPVVAVSADGVEALRALLRPLPHYGRQSYLVFDGAHMVKKGIWAARPHEWPVR